MPAAQAPRLGTTTRLGPTARAASILGSIALVGGLYKLVIDAARAGSRGAEHPNAIAERELQLARARPKPWSIAPSIVH